MPFLSRGRLSRLEARLTAIEQMLAQFGSDNNAGLHWILEEIRKMAATQQDIDNILSTVETDLAAVQSDNAAVLQKLQSITPGQPAPDLSGEVTRLQNIDTALKALATADSAATATSTSTPASGSTPAASGTTATS